jgi:hypothetical protein
MISSACHREKVRSSSNLKKSGNAAYDNGSSEKNIFLNCNYSAHM